MRALVTGGAGFLGSHLVDRLLDQNLRVKVVDDFSSGNGRMLVDGHCVTHVETVQAGCKLLEDTSFDTIFHLAARVGPADVLADPLRMLREHHDDTVAVCELAKRHNAVLVLASSSEVYQFNSRAPFAEDDELTIGPSHLPRCAYAVSKLNMEHLGLAYARQHGVKVVIARLFNVAGPRQRVAFVLPIFARAALQGQPLPVHGGGAALRCFTHVQDVVTALLALAKTPAAYGQIVNVGVPASAALSVRDLAQRVRHHVALTYGVGQRGIQWVPYSETGDAAWERMAVREANVDKLERLTGLRFSDRIDEIIAEVCADQAQQLGVAKRVAA